MEPGWEMPKWAYLLNGRTQHPGGSDGTEAGGVTTQAASLGGDGSKGGGAGEPAARRFTRDAPSSVKPVL